MLDDDQGQRQALASNRPTRYELDGVAGKELAAKRLSRSEQGDRAENASAREEVSRTGD